jgi:hypothetical protein
MIPVIVIIHRDIFIITMLIFLNLTNRQCGVMLTSSAVDRRFENRSGQTKDYEIGISSILFSDQFCFYIYSS